MRHHCPASSSEFKAQQESIFPTSDPGGVWARHANGRLKVIPLSLRLSAMVFGFDGWEIGGASGWLAVGFGADGGAEAATDCGASGVGSAGGGSAGSPSHTSEGSAHTWAAPRFDFGLSGLSTPALGLPRISRLASCSETNALPRFANAPATRARSSRSLVPLKSPRKPKATSCVISWKSRTCRSERRRPGRTRFVPFAGMVVFICRKYQPQTRYNQGARKPGHRHPRRPRPFHRLVGGRNQVGGGEPE